MYCFSFYRSSDLIILSRSIFRACYSIFFVASSHLILRYYERACASVMVLGYALVVMSNYIITAASSALSVMANSGQTRDEYLKSRVSMLVVMFVSVLANLRLRRKLEDDEINVNETLKIIPQLVIDEEDPDDSDIFARPRVKGFSKLLAHVRNFEPDG